MAPGPVAGVPGQTWERRRLLKPLSATFYARHPLDVAPALIGRTLEASTGGGLVSGRIVEVEAYCGFVDPASHAYRGRTPRNSVMFGPGGQLYVYFSYGMHHCANVVCEGEGSPGAVLLRAVEPRSGLELMRARRGGVPDRDLCRGPGRLAQAFGIDLALNGTSLIDGPVRVGGHPILRAAVAVSPRIGISRAAAEPWRFYEPGPWASPTPGAGRRSIVGPSEVPGVRGAVPGEKEVDMGVAQE